MSEPKYLSYFNENVCEDQKDVLNICETAMKQLYDQRGIGYGDPKLVGSCFSKIFETILIKLQGLEKDYSSFEINFLDRLVIGYSTKEDEDDEKQGNFMVYIRHLNAMKKNEDVDDPTLSSRERCVQWNAENIRCQPDIIDSISIAALSMINKDLETALASKEVIMPTFIYTYEAIVNYLKIARREQNKFEYEINFISCFYIGVRESEDGNDDVYIRPNIESKLLLKNDSVASAKYE